MKTLTLNFKSILSIMLLLSVLLTSCNKDDNGDSYDPNDNDDIETLNQGSDIQRDFMGKIVDESGVPIEDVNVSIGNDTAITDANGVFIINDANVKEKQAYIIAEKAGYLKGMKTTIPTQDTNIIRIMLIQENVVATVTTGATSEVNLPNGATVKFDGNFKDENGNVYSGNVDVMMYHLETSNPSIEDIMPGNLQAQNEDGDERVLESYGMINVELRGSAGEVLNIADGHVAEIELPVDASQSGVAPTTIPLWHFDEDNGYWVEEGEANLVGGNYIAEVSHFSWWNCDAPFPTVTLCLNVVDSLNSPIANTIVELWMIGATYPRSGVSNASGEICGLIPANQVLTLNVLDQCGNTIYTTNIGPFNANTNLGNIVIPSATATVITGTLVDCNSVAVTNGYVTLDYASQSAAIPVTNGSFSFNIVQCPSLPTTFNLEGIDYNTFNTSTLLPFNLSNPNIGNLIACNAVSEFISIQLDNNPVEYYLSNLGGGINGTYVSTSGANQNGDSMAIGGSSTILGTYGTTGTPSFWIESSTLDLNYNLPNTIQITLNNVGPVGGYIDMTITGTYTDNNGVLRTISGVVHVIRDY